MRAITVALVLSTDAKQEHMVAVCMGVRTIERYVDTLPVNQPAYALAMLMCHQNGWSTDLCHGLLHTGDEVFTFRINRGELMG